MVIRGDLMEEKTTQTTKLLGNSKVIEGMVLFSILKDMSLLNDYKLSDKDFLMPESKHIYNLIKLMESKGIEVVDETTVNVTISTNPTLQDFFKEYGTARDLLKQADNVRENNFDSYYDDLLKRNYLLELKEKGFNIYQYTEAFNEMNFEECVNFVEHQVISTEIGNCRVGRGLEVNGLELTDSFINELINGEVFETLSFADSCPILNGVVNGMVTGTTTIIAAPSGNGKSSFVLSNIIFPVIKSGEKVLLISNELTYKQYMMMLISIIATKELGDYSVTRDKVMKGKLEDGYNKLKAVQKYIEENIKNKIQFINYNSGEIEIVTKLMKKYHKQGFKMAVFDTMKAENSADGKAWASLIENSKQLTYTAQECKMSFIMPYQVAHSSYDRRVLSRADLSEGKGVINVASVLLMFRKVKSDEFDGGKYAIKPYTYIKNKQTGKWDKTSVEFTDKTKQYIIVTVDKNRFGKDSVHILYQFDGQYCTYRELGYCTPIPDYIKG